MNTLALERPRIGLGDSFGTLCPDIATVDLAREDLADSASTGSEGPELSPMAPGLPRTSLAACKSLVLAVLYQAIKDLDLQFVASPRFTMYGTLGGLEVDEVFAIRRVVLSGEFKPGTYAGITWSDPE